MGKSSKDKRDVYYRLAKEQGWRARSAFKLLQLDEHFDLFSGVTRVVDLCAAPGSWSQVLSRVLIKGERIGRVAWEDKRYAEMLRQREASKGESTRCFDGAMASEDRIPAPPTPGPRENVRIVAIDLQPMSSLEGITCLKADITHPSTVPLLLSALDPSYDAATSPREAAQPVDLVLSDGAPDVTGLHDLDIYVQAQLLWAALNLALCVLRPGGTFVAKIFRGKDVDLLYAQLKIVFERVAVFKPRSSRASSVEAFVVCRGFAPPEGFRASLERPFGTAGLGLKTNPKSNAPTDAEADEEHFSNDDVLEIDHEVDVVDRGGNEAVPETVRWIAPFLANGDLSSFDADASHTLPEGHISLAPVQPPTAPPYRQALEQRRKMGGAYGKTKLGEAS